MQNEEKPKPILAPVEGTAGDITDAQRQKNNSEDISRYRCEYKDKPEWCIWGNDLKGGRGVLYWIRPSQYGEWIARKISKYLNDHNPAAGASVEMTEYNSDYQGSPVYPTQPQTASDDMNDGSEVWHG